MFKRVVVLLIVLSAFVYSQEKDEFENGIGIGAKAFLFEFRGIDNLGVNSFNGGTYTVMGETLSIGGIGGKYFFSPEMAIRGSILFNRESATDAANPLPGYSGKDGEQTLTIFGLSGGVEYHLPAITNRVSPYFGGELGYYHASYEEKETVIYYPGTDVTRDVFSIEGISIFTVSAIAGAEIFLLKEVSLSAEYSLYLNMMSLGDSKYSEERVSGTPTIDPAYKEENGSASQINTSSRATLILAIYF